MRIHVVNGKARRTPMHGWYNAKRKAAKSEVRTLTAEERKAFAAERGLQAR